MESLSSLVVLLEGTWSLLTAGAILWSSDTRELQIICLSFGISGVRSGECGEDFCWCANSIKDINSRSGMCFHVLHLHPAQRTPRPCCCQHLLATATSRLITTWDGRILRQSCAVPLAEAWKPRNHVCHLESSHSKSLSYRDCMQ